jgi:hypothetical protein
MPALLERSHIQVACLVGEAEQLRTEYGKEKIHLKSRKGFVRLAMEEGAHLVPIYVFGETSLYKVSMLRFSASAAVDI